MQGTTKTIGLLLVALAITSTASAGVLATDTNAIGAFQGSVNMADSFQPVPGYPLFYNVNADVDFAVYAPNAGNSNFDLTFGSGADPSNGADFVYAYQVFNLASMSSAITSFSVGLDGDEYNLGVVPQFIGFIVGADVAPNDSRFVPADGSVPPTSARWDYDLSPYLPVGQDSVVLFYTCPSGPEWDNGTVNGATAATASVPGPMEADPIPEPVTMSLFGLSAIGLCVRRRRTR